MSIIVRARLNDEELAKFKALQSILGLSDQIYGAEAKTIKTAIEMAIQLHHIQNKVKEDFYLNDKSENS